MAAETIRLGGKSCARNGALGDEMGKWGRNTPGQFCIG